jgi:hypothetical protein
MGYAKQDIIGSSNISESNAKTSKEIDGPPNLNLPTSSAKSIDAFDKNCNNNTNGDAKHDIMDPLVRSQSSVVHHCMAEVPSALTIDTGAVNKIVIGDAIASDAEKGSTPKCS